MQNLQCVVATVGVTEAIVKPLFCVGVAYVKF